MKREEKLKEAFSNAAIEETEQLEQSLTYKEREKAGHRDRDRNA